MLVKLLYSALLAVVALAAAGELLRIWTDRRLYIGAFEVAAADVVSADLGEERGQVIFHQLQEYSQRGIGGTSDTTYNIAPDEQATVAEDTFADLALTYQNVNIGQLLSGLRKSLAQPNEVSGSVTELGGQSWAWVTWPRAAGRAGQRPGYRRALRRRLERRERQVQLVRTDHSSRQSRRHSSRHRMGRAFSCRCACTGATLNSYCAHACPNCTQHRDIHYNLALLTPARPERKWKMNAVLFLLAFCVGLFISVQAAVNSQLASALHANSVVAAWISFTVGTVVLGIAAFARGGVGEALGALVHQPLWKMSGGLLGAAFVFGTVFLAPRIGLLNLVVLVIAGQLMMSMAIDNFGLVNMAVRKVSGIRLAGALVVVAGVALTLFGDRIVAALER